MARHPLDLTSLLAGLAFVAIGIASLVGDLSFGAHLDVVWPVLLAALGLGLLLGGRARAGRRAAGDGA